MCIEDAPAGPPPIPQSRAPPKMPAPRVAAAPREKGHSPIKGAAAHLLRVGVVQEDAPRPRAHRQQGAPVVEGEAHPPHAVALLQAQLLRGGGGGAGVGAVECTQPRMGQGHAPSRQPCRPGSRQPSPCHTQPPSSCPPLPATTSPAHAWMSSTSPSVACAGVEASGRQASSRLSVDLLSTQSPSQRRQST